MIRIEVNIGTNAKELGFSYNETCNVFECFVETWDEAFNIAERLEGVDGSKFFGSSRHLAGELDMFANRYETDELHICFA